MAVSSPNEFRLPVAEREDVAEVFLTMISKRPVRRAVLSNSWKTPWTHSQLSLPKKGS